MANRNPKKEVDKRVDNWQAMQQMMATRGWKIFQQKVEEIGSEYMAEALNIDLPPGKGHTKRDLRVHQCEVVKKICAIPEIIEEEFQAKVAADEANKGGPSA